MKCIVCDEETNKSVRVSLGVDKCKECGHEKSLMEEIPVCEAHSNIMSSPSGAVAVIAKMRK